MATWLITVLFSVGAVLLFVVGLSLTLMIKGHHIDSEIASNRNMRARGISCPAHDARAVHYSDVRGTSEDTARLSADARTASVSSLSAASLCGEAGCADPGCSTCTTKG